MQEAVVCVRLKTPPALYWHALRKGGPHVSPGVLVRLGSTIASVIALVHAHVSRLVFCPYEVRAERAAVVYLRLKYTTGGIFCVSELQMCYDALTIQIPV